MARLIRERPDTISLGQGMVAYGPPGPAIARAHLAASRGEADGYDEVWGLPELVDHLERKLARENGITVRPDSRLAVTAGANMAFLAAVLATTDPGDEVVFPTPFYFNYPMAVQMASARPVPVPTDERYQLRVDRIEAAITPRTRAVVTVSPNNPTGAVLREEDLRHVNALCADRGLYHINDEVYEYFTFDGARHFSPGSAAGASAHTISLHSFSKAYGMAGWRVGYLVAPKRLAPALEQILDTMLICAPLASQHAALGALEVGAAYCRDHLPALAAVRSLVLGALSEVADRCTVPPCEGALYCFPRLHTSLDSMTLVERLVREQGVAAIPGSAFGVDEPCCLRIAYGALDADAAAEGMHRLVRGLKAGLAW